MQERLEESNLSRTSSEGRHAKKDQRPNEGMKYTGYQKWVLVCISLICFTSYLLMAILAPFFPSEATKKGMSTTLSGLTFSVYAFVIMVTSPIFGKLIPIVKPKPMLLMGVLLSGTSNIAFGVLDRVNDSTMFIASSIIIRCLEGLGAAAFSTASYTYIMYTFSNGVSAAFGITETFIGIGETIGPAVGGGLYALGGYGLPFYVLGSFVILTIPLSWFILKPINEPVSDGITDEEQHDCKSSRSREADEQTCLLCSPSSSTFESGASSSDPLIDDPSEDRSRVTTEVSYWNLIRIPEIVVVSLVVIIISNSQAFLEPTIEPHFEKSLSKDANFVAIVFLVMAIAYAVMSPTTGYFAGGIINKYTLMLSGLSISSVGLLLLGPSRIIPFIEPSVPLAYVSMVLMGASYALAFIPTFETLLEISLENGFPDDVRTYSLISGLWGCMFSLGEVTGPVFGGVLVDSLDFNTASTVMSMLSTACVLISVVVLIIRKSSRILKVKRKQYVNNLTVADRQTTEQIKYNNLR